jgi:methyl-accepting chemotaxis protein
MAAHSSIRQRLLLLIVVPLVSLVVTGGTLIRDSFKNYRSAEQTQAVLHLAVAVGNLVHALQIERGATAGFLQSKGAKFADALPGIRGATDEKLSGFNNELRRLDIESMPALANSLKGAQDLVATLPQLRDRAGKHSIAVPEHVAAYTKTIGALIDTIGATSQFNSDAKIGQQLLSYLSFIQAKEQAGQERALTTAAFAANLIDPPRYRQILERHFRQEAYLDSFRSTADPAEKDALGSLLTSQSAKDVQSMRSSLYEKAASGGFDIDPQTWFKTITEKIDAMLGVELLVAKNIDHRAAQIVAGQRNQFYGYIALTLLAIVVMLAVATWVSVSVSRPLKAEVKVAEYAIRERDFSQSVPEAGPAEVVRAGKAFNELMREFRSIIAEVKQSSERITGAAHNLSTSSQQVQESSSSQSDAASAVAAAVQEASVSVSETAANAKIATDVVNTAKQDTTAATAVMTEAVSTMKRIADLIRLSSINVNNLDVCSEKIGGIIQVIREIADQTNLLALNAAIEAARAGEQGRGFAVVADEVRKLAERTAKATSEIGGLISVIQSGIGLAVTSMQEADGQASQSLQLAGKTEEALIRIGQGSEQVAENVFSISGALAELDSAIREVAVNVEKIAQMTEVNNGAAVANYSTARDLDRLSSELRESVAIYKI